MFEIRNYLAERRHVNEVGTSADSIRCLAVEGLNLRNGIAIPIESPSDARRSRGVTQQAVVNVGMAGSVVSTGRDVIAVRIDDGVDNVVGDLILRPVEVHIDAAVDIVNRVVEYMRIESGIARPDRDALTLGKSMGIRV